MGEAKPTPGVWKAKGRDVFIGRLRVVHAANAASQKPMNMRDEVEQAQENARFIADAGNTYNTTGLTPSQLVERVKELEETLRSLHERFRSCSVAGASAEEAYDSFYQEIVAAALAKARPNTAEGEAAQQAPAGAAEIEELRALSVTNIMIDVVPGDDGMGHEVYAKSVDDVVNKLTAMGAELEDWQLGIRRYEHSPTAQAAPAAAKEPSP